jgi:hypothetical protein
MIEELSKLRFEVAPRGLYRLDVDPDLLLALTTDFRRSLAFELDLLVLRG